MPFRARPDQHLGPLAADAAVHDAVGQMVRQFADELAFLRELVQNSLDADATAIEVLFDHHPVDGRAVLEVSVRDDGRGMDQPTLERCLLVLFRSSKEGDPTRIGKFGVGFFSVFAARPDLVTVETGTDAQAPGLRLRLLPDFTWELEHAAPRRGTSVRVRVPLRDEAPTRLADRCVERLRHWCPHVRVPVTARFHNVPGRDDDARIDAPHRLDAEVFVRAQHGEAVTLVGLSDAPTRRYLNRGLLLQAEEGAQEPEHRGLAWLIDAPDLHHTISRDAVVRDAAFAARLRAVPDIAQNALRDKVIRAWNELAERCAAARAERRADAAAGAALGRLARALLQRPFALRPKDLRWPLAEPTDEDRRPVRTRPLAAGLLGGPKFFTAREASALTRAVAQSGGVVLDAGACGDSDADAAVNALRQDLCPDARACDRAFVLLRRVDPVRHHPAARALLDALVALVTGAHLGAVMLCEALGSGADRLWYSVRGGHPAVHGEGIADLDDDSPFAFRRGGVLLLRADHPDAALALEHARRDPRFAALVLLRLALLHAGALDARSDHALLRQHAAVGA
ncbi:MAG: ATP-binding protein [Polyangiales bacterium]